MEAAFAWRTASFQICGISSCKDAARCILLAEFQIMYRVSSRILAASVLLLSAVGAARAGTTWAPTATKSLQLVNASLIGAMPANMPVKVAVAVQGRNVSQLGAFARNASTPGNPAFGRYLTSAQY